MGRSSGGLSHGDRPGPCPSVRDRSSKPGASVNLDPTAEEIRKWGDAAFETVAEYLESIRDRPVYSPASSAAIRKTLDRHLPEDPSPFNDLLRDFRDAIIEFSRQNPHPRMFGYVQSPGTVL